MNRAAGIPAERRVPAPGRGARTGSIQAWPGARRSRPGRRRCRAGWPATEGCLRPQKSIASMKLPMAVSRNDPVCLSAAGCGPIDEQLGRPVHRVDESAMTGRYGASWRGRAAGRLQDGVPCVEPDGHARLAMPFVISPSSSRPVDGPIGTSAWPTTIRCRTPLPARKRRVVCGSSLLPSRRPSCNLTDSTGPQHFQFATRRTPSAG